jgi:hypothetical protein
LSSIFEECVFFRNLWIDIWLKPPKNHVKIRIFKGRFEKSKKSIFSIKKAHILQLKLINAPNQCAQQTYQWTTFKMEFLDQKQSVLVSPNLHVNAKNWSQIATFQDDLKKTKQISF